MILLFVVSQVDFPLWMARPLAGKGMVDLDLPKHYTDRYSTVASSPSRSKRPSRLARHADRAEYMHAWQ